MSEKLFTDAKTLQTKNQLVLDACEITLKHPNFQSDLIQLTKNELSLVELRRPLSDNQISRLLETASLFALTNDIAYEKLAYKMAVYLLSQYKTDYPTLPAAVEIIMSRLGDLPTIHSIIENQDGKDYFSYFEPETFDQNTVSTYLKFPEVLVKKITNRIKITDQKSLTFTDFQARIYSLLREKQNVIFSAPTSTGKSYVLHNYIAESLLNSREYCAVYIAPTKALIAEVQANIEETITSFGARLDEFAVFLSSNFLNMEEVKETKKKVFVLTQERLQEAMANNPLTNVKLLVVDEAQKISDESRGVIIEDAVQDLIEYNPNVQKVVISPYTQNPEKFKLVFNIQDEIIAEKTSKSPVGQNFFLVKFEGKKVIISLLSWGLEVSEEEKILYEMTLESLLPSKSKRKAWVVNNLVTKGEPTIIYCDRPYDCRRVAENIAEGSEKSEPSDELKKAIDFFSEYVHKQYYLCDSLKNRIGYHYGKMPQFVRFLVKNLFERKKIDLLCCTSTLLEGVNLPAKNIVLYNPKAGKIMDRLSLLNLAGRAGRLRKDYYGKIYCINMDEWESGDDVFEAKLEDVESSVEQTLAKTLTL